MLNLTQIISEGGTDHIRDYQSRFTEPIKISWNSFKKSRSQSPKCNHYNFKLMKIPDSSIEAIHKQESQKVAKKNGLKQRVELTPITLAHPSNSEVKHRQEFDKNAALKIKLPDESLIQENIQEISFSTIKENLDKEELVEEHPLYANKFKKIINNTPTNGVSTNSKSKSPYLNSKSPLTPKQISKENRIKLFHLNHLLEKAEETPTLQNALICLKILDVLEEGPELFEEISQNLTKFIKKFLFCTEEKVYETISNLKAEQKLQKPQTFLKLLQISFEITEEINCKNLKNFELKNQEISYLTRNSNAFEEELAQVKKILKNINEEMLIQKETDEKSLIEKVIHFFRFRFNISLDRTHDNK